MEADTLGLLPSRGRVLRNIALSFVLATALLVVFIAFTALSRASIRITLGAVERDVLYQVTVAEQSLGQTLPAGAIAGTFFESTLTESGSFPLSAGTDDLSQKAGGLITITNRTNRDQPLVATTRFLANGELLFRLVQTVRVPAGGSVTALVEADEPGTRYAIAPGQLTIPGLSATLQNDIYGTAEAPFVLGGARGRVVTEQDIETARQTLTARMLDQVRATVGEQVAEGDLGDQDFVIVLVSEKLSHQAGDEAAALDLTLTQKITAVAFNKEVLKTRVAEIAGGDVSVRSDDPLRYTIGSLDPIKRTAVVNGKARVGARVDKQSSVFSPVNFAGATPDEVRQFLKKFEGVEEVTVQISPYWQKRLPRIPTRIRVEFD